MRREIMVEWKYGVEGIGGIIGVRDGNGMEFIENGVMWGIGEKGVLVGCWGERGG